MKLIPEYNCRDFSGTYFIHSHCVAIYPKGSAAILTKRQVEDILKRMNKMEKENVKQEGS